MIEQLFIMNMIFNLKAVPFVLTVVQISFCIQAFNIFIDIIHKCEY